nr:hypothetical protein GCM10020093_022430 [Planobispora longispora]
MVGEAELRYLRRCVELAAEALEEGDEPFGSVLVAADGTILAEDHNRVASGDRTRHPEFELARWAAANMTPGSGRRRPSSPRASTARCALRRTAGWGWGASCTRALRNSWRAGWPSWGARAPGADPARPRGRARGGGGGSRRRSRGGGA